MNYGPETDPLATLARTEVGTISVYARGRDYHDVMKGRLKELAGLLARDTGEDVKVFVDTAPLMEKPLAMAGGTCRACLDVCPTDAFPHPYQLDARRCISYLTIEHDGPVEIELRAKMGNRIYGCDDCLAVCPWNKFAQAGAEAKLVAREDLNAPDLRALAALGDVGFRKTFAGSPIKRIGWARFLRNVLYAVGNSGRIELRDVALAYVETDDATVRDAAQWAVERLG